MPAMIQNKIKFAALSFLALGAVMVACTPVVEEYREVTAERIARPAFLVDRRYATPEMDFQLWVRMHKHDAPANVYIEGDGEATYLIRDITEDSTPENPVGLHLASRDNAANLVYISRPCMYKESPDKEACNPAYFSNRRFSPEVLAAYDELLNEIKLRYDITEFNLIGYDGGANIAAALATTRNDVASLRTVAGNLVPSLIYGQTGQVLDADYITADKIAAGLAEIPQHHFIGAGDTVAPPSVYHSFRQSMGESTCVHYTLVQDADHERGWVEKWPDLLKSSMECPPPYVPIALPPLPPSKDGPNK